MKKNHGDTETRRKIPVTFLTADGKPFELNAPPPLCRRIFEKLEATDTGVVFSAEDVAELVGTTIGSLRQHRKNSYLAANVEKIAHTNWWGSRATIAALRERLK